VTIDAGVSIRRARCEGWCLAQRARPAAPAPERDDEQKTAVEGKGADLTAVNQAASRW